ncbi:MAG: glycosyltransferase family 9 protein, partial [bacterium]
YLLRPRTVFLRRVSNALGDNLLLTAVLPGLRRKYPDHKIVVETPWPELFRNNPHIDWVTDRHMKTTRRHIKPVYRVRGRGGPSLIAQMMAYVEGGLEGSPELYLEPQELEWARERYDGEYIAICPTNPGDFCANRKEWGTGNFQALRNLLEDYAFVQIGLASDPLLENVIDARGLPVRRSAAVLKNSLFFVGLVGGLMHLARAVGVRSAIIYGGYEHPEITEYPGNLSFYNDVDCSPCYDSQKAQQSCDTMKCMAGIDPREVHDAIRREFLDGKQGRMGTDR